MSADEYFAEGPGSMSCSSNTCGIARIVKPAPDGQGETHVGMALIADARHVITCCHVLNDALDRKNRLDPEKPTPDSMFSIRFPYADNSVRSGHVVAWGLTLAQAKDVAVLELLDADAPSDAGIVVFSEREVRLEKWSCIGRRIDGTRQEAGGVCGTILDTGERQLNGSEGIGPRIESGFSGAAVWCEHTQSFVGMVVTKDWNQAETGLGYAIPTGVLQQIWPKLKLVQGQMFPQPSNTAGEGFRIDPTRRATVNPSPPTVMIRVLPLGDDTYHLQSWIQPPGGERMILPNARDISKGEIPKFLASVRSRAIKRLTALALQYSPDDINVEFILPSSDIDLDVDTWEFEHYGDLIRIGSHHRVSVRRLEAHGGSDIHGYMRWRSQLVATTTKFAETLTKLPPEGVGFVLTREAVTETLSEDLLNAKEVSCVCLLCQTDRDANSVYRNALKAVLNAGVPVVLWMRKLLWDEPAVREKLNFLCTEEGLGRLSDLPDKVRTERRAARKDQAHMGSHIVLLYEESDRPVSDFGKMRPGPEGRSHR